jgi:hypothetical protein
VLRERNSDSVASTDKSRREHPEAGGRELRPARTGEQAAPRGQERPEIKCLRHAAERFLSPILKRLRKLAPGAENHRADSGRGDLERFRNLRVAQPLPLAQQERPAKVLRHRVKGGTEADELLVAITAATRQLLLELLEMLGRLGPSPPATPKLRNADVVGDLVQPACLEPWHDPLLHRSVDEQERRLGCVFGVLSRAQPSLAIPLDSPAVLLI